MVDKVTEVPAATLDTIGKGKVGRAADADDRPAAVLKADGKPLVFYMGAEYCPYCAAERWSMIIALSRFGTFSNLGQTFSSSTDVDPNTPTFSFHGATYTSKYLTFQAKELQSNEQTGNGQYAAARHAHADQTGAGQAVQPGRLVPVRRLRQPGDDRRRQLRPGDPRRHDPGTGRGRAVGPDQQGRPGDRRHRERDHRRSCASSPAASRPTCARARPSTAYGTTNG